MVFKRKPILSVSTRFDPVCPKCGPYEASEGTYPGHGQRKKLRVDSIFSGWEF
jgi:hypothetical protein